MSDRSRLFLKIVVAALVVVFLFRNPMTRAVILWLLPLGSGIDDLIVIIALIVGGVFCLYYLFSRKAT
ncbi:hypothetical protein KAZ66_05420 [Candidatus Woesebacteria bacterium]|nr:hypothetical protein [Candidatus Woesebacteria bacterium]